MIRRILASAATGRRDIVAFTVEAVKFKDFGLSFTSAATDCVVELGTQGRVRIVGERMTMMIWMYSGRAQIRIIGVAPEFSVQWGGTKPVSVDLVDSVSLRSLKGAFMNGSGLVSVPDVIRAPNLTDCRDMFRDCGSITSDLPALWLTHPDARHEGAFTASYLTMWRLYGMKCGERTHVPASGQEMTFYEHFGAGNCLTTKDNINGKGTLVPAVPPRTWWELKGTDCIHRVTKGYVEKRTQWDLKSTRCTYRKEVGSDPIYMYQATIAKGYACSYRQTIKGRPQEKAFERYGGCDGCTWWNAGDISKAGWVFGRCPSCGGPFFALGDNGLECENVTGWGGLSRGYCGKAINNASIHAKTDPTTLVTITTKAYVNKKCASCGRTLGQLDGELLLPAGRASYPYHCRQVLPATADQYKCLVQRESGLVDCGPTCRKVSTPGTAYGTICQQSALSLQTECSSSCAWVVQQGNPGYPGCRYPNLSGVTGECGQACAYRASDGTPEWVRCSVPQFSLVQDAKCGPGCRLMWSTASPERFVCERSGGECVESRCDLPTNANSGSVEAAKAHEWA